MTKTTRTDAKLKAIDHTLMTGRLMTRARELAKTGLYPHFRAVAEKVAHESPDAPILRLWATARDEDEIDRLCRTAAKRVTRVGAPRQSPKKPPFNGSVSRSR